MLPHVNLFKQISME